MPRAAFRLLRETGDLRVAEAIQTVLKREGIGAVIVGDEAVQHLPTAERHAGSFGSRFRVEVPVELHETASKLLRKLENSNE